VSFQRALRRLLALALLAALASAARAMDPSLPLAQLHRTRWTPREGAPADVSALAQTPDGALWIAASTGLLRFDGVRFDRFRARPGEASLSEDLSALYTSPGGELWIGGRLGGVHVLRGGHLTSWDARDGLPVNTVLAFAQLPDGRTWVGTTNGLYLLEGARWTAIGAERGLPARFISSLLVDARGSLWATGLDGTFELPKGAATFTRRIAGNDGLGVLGRGPDGAAWLASRDRGLRPVPADAAAAPPRDARGPQFNAFLFDRDGGLWLSAEHDGISRVPSGERLGGSGRAQALAQLEHPARESTPPPDRLDAILEDLEGDIWIGSTDGIERFRRVRIRPVAASSGAWPAVALAVDPAGVAQAVNLDGDRLELATPPVMHPRHPGGVRIATLAIAPDGTHWGGGVGELTRELGPRWSRIPTRVPGTVVQALAPEPGGALWVSIVRDGLYRYDGTSWTPAGGVTGLPDAPALSLRRDDHGRLWAGYAGDRIALIDRGKARVFGASDGLRIGAVLAIATRGERTWVGGTGGVAYYLHGRFWSVLRADGSDIAGVSGIVPSADGELWINGGAGVTRIPAAEVERFAADPSRRVAAETFDYEDGLDGIAAQLRPVPSAVEGGDGRLWFATSRNVFTIDPRRIPRNQVAPGVRILALRADGIDRSPAPGLSLPVGSDKVSFDYTAFSLAIPERVRFRYRLDGVDADWQDAGARRQAFYTNVGPGHYRFHVAAANEDGVWNETGDSLEFTIPPAFWQTGWFAGLCALAALALLGSLYTLRLRQLAARMATQRDARLQERERIARELHDTLLQSTQGLILSFQGFALQLPPASPMRERMETTLDRADQILADARGRVLDLRSAGLAGQALPEALAQAASELAREGGPSFRAVVDGNPRELAPAIEIECYRIAREALVNAFAHAQAQAIELQVVYGALALRVRIRDDGRGIAAEVLAAGERPGHWGLAGMRERAQRFGARVELWSRPGAGTEVELTVPAAVAYQRTRARRWWRRRESEN